MLLVNGVCDLSYSDFGVMLKFQFDLYWLISGGIIYVINVNFYCCIVSFFDVNDICNVGGSCGFLML